MRSSHLDLQQNGLDVIFNAFYPEWSYSIDDLCLLVPNLTRTRVLQIVKGYMQNNLILEDNWKYRLTGFAKTVFELYKDSAEELIISFLSEK